jgi:hypothetical protein
MPDHPVAPAPNVRRQQARELVIQRLSLVSTVIWVVGILVFLTAIYPGRPLRPSSGALFGTFMLCIAAIPWLAYGPLVERAAGGQPRE